MDRWREWITTCLRVFSREFRSLDSSMRSRRVMTNFAFVSLATVWGIGFLHDFSAKRHFLAAAEIFLEPFKCSWAEFQAASIMGRTSGLRAQLFSN